MSYSSITVVFEPELKMLKAQAHSMAQYWKCSGKILVIVNDRPEVNQKIDKSWWGPLSNQVQIINRNKWFEDVPLTGWVSQQILKLLASTVVATKWSIVLDAKTLFVKTFNDNDFCDADGRISAKHQELLPVFNNSKQIIDNLFDINFTAVAGPGGVPHWINSTEMKNMMLDIVDLTGKNLIEFWSENGMLTEFMLHSGYIQYKHGSINHYYSNKQEFNVVNIAHNETGIFDYKFNEMHNDNVLTVSIHRNAWDLLDLNQRQKFNHFLESKNLISYDHT
jgi:hypothetical protein